MPLVHSSSDRAFRTNVKNLMHEAKAGTSKHVKSRDQALAIAYSIKRRGRKSGGRAYDGGGFVNPNAAPVSGPPMPQSAPAAAPPQAPALYTPPPAQAALQPQPQALAPSAPDGRLGGFGGGGLPNGFGGGLASLPPGSTPFGGLTWGVGGPGGTNQAPWMSGMAGFGFPSGSMGPNPQPQGYALGGAPAPWFVRNEARGMMHSGPVSSIVPGRTDRHNVSVGSGSYIVPADVVSHLGQNNSAAGSAVLSHMFNAGPLGMGRASGIKHGIGAPRPPKMQGVMRRGGATDAGGARGTGSRTGEPVDIVVAGGEHALSPEQVARVGHGDIGLGHKILDAFVLAVRKKHIKTLKGLPPPAKA